MLSAIRMKAYRTDEILTEQLPALPPGKRFRLELGSTDFLVSVVSCKTERASVVLQGKANHLTLSEIRAFKSYGNEVVQS